MMNHESLDDLSIETPGKHAESRLHHALDRIASILTSAVAVLLIVFVMVALVGVVAEGLGPLLTRHEFTLSAVQGVNSAFLAIILLELVHTTVSRGPMTRQVQEFLVIGVTVGVRNGLEVAARASEQGSRDVAVTLVYNAAAVLILVVALCLVRHRLHADQASKGHPERDAP